MNPLQLFKKQVKEEDEPKSMPSVTTVQIPRDNIGVEIQLLVFRIINMFLQHG